MGDFYLKLGDFCFRRFFIIGRSWAIILFQAVQSHCHGPEQALLDRRQALQLHVGAGEGVVDDLKAGAVLVVPAVAVATYPLRRGWRLLSRRVVEPTDGAHPSLCPAEVVDT